MAAREGESVRGVLPLTKVSSRLFGKRMVSQAFSNYGGPLADNASAVDELLNSAFEIALEHGCSSVELRNIEALPYDLVSQEDKVCMVLPLARDPDKLWRGFRPEIRNRVRKAEKSGLVAASGGQELLRDFYLLWTIRMRQLGTPCYPESLFRNILETFPEHARIFIVRRGRITAGAAFDYSFNGFAQCRWAATRVELNQAAPNTLLYWSAIRHYCLAGDRVFDFGRSTVGSGQYEFKRRWGAQPVQLNYQYWVRPDKKFRPVRPDNPRYSRLVKTWTKLPLGITRFLGPHISKSLA